MYLNGTTMERVFSPFSLHMFLRHWTLFSHLSKEFLFSLPQGRCKSAFMRFLIVWFLIDVEESNSWKVPRRSYSYWNKGGIVPKWMDTWFIFTCFFPTLLQLWYVCKVVAIILVCLLFMVLILSIISLC